MTLRTTMLRTMTLLFVCLAACAKKDSQGDPAAIVETVAEVDMIDYDPPAGTFACRAPARWKGEETSRFGPDETTFIGPLSGPRPVSVFINISRYPNSSDKYVDAETYAQSWKFVDYRPTQYTKKKIGGRNVIFFSREYPFKKPHSTKTEYMVRKDIALIPVKGGFFAIDHSAPSDSYERTLPVFEAIVRSFQPKS